MLVGTILILVAYWAVVVYIVRSLVVATRQTPKPNTSAVADKPMLTRRAAKRRANKAAGRVLSQAEFNQMYANGRPTMPSQVEPEDEFERRAPRHAAIQRMAQDAVDQGVYDKFVEGE